ncbi:hypothetical protein NA78x_004976 [Anatilimnocola sp. NA78]|uniref:hypothetical protein n=1 Tax=Anatilimnocola sp. NA78 TaxID=3415683 RepID=UPI003CE4559C
MKTMLALVGLFLIGCDCSIGAQAQESLAWKFEKGQKFTLQTQQQTQSLVSFGAKQIPSNVDLLLSVSWEVQAAEAEQFTIEQTVDFIRIEMKGQGEASLTYDSREKKAVVGAAKDLATAVAPVLGTKSTFTMTPQGEVAPVAPAAAEPPKEAEPASPAKEKDLRKESISQLLKQSLLPLPQAFEGSMPTWTDVRETTAALGKVKQTRKFTFAGNEDRDGKPAAKITVQGELELTPPAAVKTPPKLKQQSLSGTVWFSRESGRALSSETTQKIVTESMYRDSSITVEVTTTIKNTLSPRE